MSVRNRVKQLEDTAEHFQRVIDRVHDDRRRLEDRLEKLEREVDTATKINVLSADGSFWHEVDINEAVEFLLKDADLVWHEATLGPAKGGKR